MRYPLVRRCAQEIGGVTGVCLSFKRQVVCFRLWGDFLNAINPFRIMEIFVPDSVIFLTRSLVRTPDEGIDLINSYS